MDTEVSSSAQAMQFYSSDYGTDSSSEKLNLSLDEMPINRPFQAILDEIIQATSTADSSASTTISTEPSFKELVMQITETLLKEHSQISIDPDMLGGMPHLKGFRLSVGDVLSKIYIYESIEKIQEIYPDIPKSQIKEAIAFAQDFLENACASR